jgi:SAM-dependent methyltransferase
MASILDLAWAYRFFVYWIKSDAFAKLYEEEHLRCEPSFKVLDLGCGPADILNRLPKSVEYHGIDFNSRYIAFARSRYGNRGHFYCETFNNSLLDRFHSFDLIMANGVIHHLDDGVASDMLNLASHALKLSGRFVTIDGVYFSGQNWLSRLVVSLDRGRFVRTKDAYLALVQPYFKSVKATIYDGKIRIPYSQIVLEMSDPITT